ncbi:hypothetical protein J6590_041534, partial [Homalodisca vitripennis]
EPCDFSLVQGQNICMSRFKAAWTYYIKRQHCNALLYTALFLVVLGDPYFMPSMPHDIFDDLSLPITKNWHLVDAMVRRSAEGHTLENVQSPGSHGRAFETNSCPLSAMADYW